MFLLMKPSVLLAFAVMLFTWVFHRSFEMVILRYLASLRHEAGPEK